MGKRIRQENWILTAINKLNQSKIDKKENIKLIYLHPKLKLKENKNLLTIKIKK